MPTDDSSDGNTEEPQTEEKHELEAKFQAAGLGLFFVWVGVALLAGLGWG